MNKEEMKNEIEKLEERIKGLERDLDEVCQELERQYKLRTAVLEIEDYLNKKNNGFEANYFPTLTYSKK
jgi:archaellum component FlaC